MMTDRLIEKFSENPKTLFVVDGLGAGLTAFMLGIVLIKFERIFRIPSSTLYILAVIPIAFMIYDIYCYTQIDKRVNKKRALYLKGIAGLNILYCLVSLGFAVNHVNDITIWAWVYITGEIVIIISLVLIEIRVANTLMLKSN